MAEDVLHGGAVVRRGGLLDGPARLAGIDVVARALREEDVRLRVEVELKHRLSLALKLHVNLRGDTLCFAARGRGVVAGDLPLAAATVRLLVVGKTCLPLVRFFVDNSYRFG